MRRKNISKGQSIAVLAGCLLLLSASDAFAQSSSDRSDGSFEVPGWFTKDKSDIARYPVPLFQSQPQSSASATSSALSPLVVIQKFGGLTTKQIYRPTPFGFYQPRTDFSALASNPWAAPGATPFGYAPAGYYNGAFGAPTRSIPSLAGYRYGFNGGWGAVGAGFGFNNVRTQIVLPPENKPVSNYYTPTAPGNAGNGYYASSTPVTPTAPVITIPPKQSPREYWGDSGNPFGNDLNKTPW